MTSAAPVVLVGQDGATAATTANPIPVNISSGATDQDVNLVGINGVAPSVGAGASGTGVQRVTLASDDPAVTALAAVKPYAASSLDWQYAAATAGISNTTTAVTFKAAHASLRNYITAIQMTSDALGAATELAIRDGAGGAVLWRTKIGTAGIVNGISIRFPTPIKGTAATLLEVVTLTASITGAVYFNAQGYVAT